MQTNPKERSYSGLIALLGLLAIVVGLIVMLLLPRIRLAAYGNLALGAALLAIAFIIEFRQFSGALTGRRGRFSAGTTVMASIFIGIILLVNAISIGNYHRFDVTALAEFTLTSTTKDVLSNLSAPVKALCFFIPDDPYGIGNYASSLLAEYQNYTDKLSIEVIDPDEHPDQARQYNIAQYQTIVFESQGHYRLVSPDEIVLVDSTGQPVGVEAEHDFTSAILEVTGAVQKKAYFLTVHGEGDIDLDFSYAKDGLLDNLYKIETLNLFITDGIPEDCDVLVIAGASKPLDSTEVEMINSYLNNGGHALILLNPNPPQELRQILSNWRINIEDGVVIDPSSYVAPNQETPSVPRTRYAFGLTQAIYFPEATAVIPQEQTEGGQIKVIPLAWTSPEAWLEKNFVAGKEPTFDNGTDVKGPLALGTLITTSTTNPTTGQEENTWIHLAIIGDSDFASNNHFNNGSNGEFFLQTVNVLTTGKELISIERKVLPFRRLIIGQEVVNFIRYSSVGLLPLLVLMAAGVIWWRRR
ncbi:MAG: GldG family protein [Chloroflexota bacterium]